MVCFQSCLCFVRFSKCKFAATGVTRWCLEKKEQVSQVNLHDSLTTCVKMSNCNRMIASTCFDGVVRVWDSEWRLLSEVRPHTSPARHVAWSPCENKDVYLACINMGDGHYCPSHLTVYKLSEDKKSLTMCFQKSDTSAYRCEFDHKSCLLVWEIKTPQSKPSLVKYTVDG